MGILGKEIYLWSNASAPEHGSYSEENLFTEAMWDRWKRFLRFDGNRRMIVCDCRRSRQLKEHGLKWVILRVQSSSHEEKDSSKKLLL